MTEQIEHDDYTLSPSGHLGGMTSVAQSTNFLGEFSEEDDALEAIKEHMEENQYWPSIWRISDHGNPLLIDINGNEIKD